MKAHLMYRDRDLELYQLPAPNRHVRKQDEDRNALLRALLWNAPALLQDLELDTLLRAMARGDEFVSEVAQQVLFSGFENTASVILYRQAIVKDCLRNSAGVRALYDLMTSAGEQTRRHWWGFSSEYPGSMLYSSVELMDTFVVVLRKLRVAAEKHAADFTSEGFKSFLSMLRSELNEDYLVTIKHRLKELRFRRGVLLSVELGEHNEGVQYVLRRAHDKKESWLNRLFGNGPSGYTFHLDPRDEAGGRILTDMRNRGIIRAARALAQSADHVLSFFQILRTELAFYVGCINLHEEISARGMPIAFPVPREPGESCREFRGLYDVSLALTLNGRVVGNDTNADGTNLVIITGANQGGKSTFLRSVGLAQIMMQCGLFVGADFFSADLCPALFTHYKREEDTTMKSGKFDEELARLSDIADHVVPHSILLFNESFAATNDREGSDIAAQIVRALLEKRNRVFYVTHLYDFASRFFAEQGNGTLFLRAERNADGSRTFRLSEGRPLETSYGEDLYREVFQLGSTA